MLEDNANSVERLFGCVLLCVPDGGQHIPNIPWIYLYDGDAPQLGHNVQLKR